MTMPRCVPKKESQLPVEKQYTEEEFDFILRTNLSPKHYDDPNVMKFIMVYVDTNNVEIAAKEGGLPDKRSGTNLLKRKDVFEAVRQLRLKVNYKGYTGDEIAARVNEIAQPNIKAIFNEDGTIKRWHELPDNVLPAVKEIVVREEFVSDVNGIKEFSGYIVRVKFKDNLKALELLGRDEGKFVERKIVENDIGKNMRDILLSKSRAAERIAELEQKRLSVPNEMLIPEVKKVNDEA